MLTGQPGDPIVGFRHLKQPAQEVGPLMLSHDESSGTISNQSSTDPVALAKEAGDEGITAKGLAMVMFDTAKPSRGEIEKDAGILAPAAVAYPRPHSRRASVVRRRSDGRVPTAPQCAADSASSGTSRQGRARRLDRCQRQLRSSRASPGDRQGCR
jgi:hypothetical protein